MSQEFCQKLVEMGERLFKFRDVDNAMFENMHTKVSSLLTQVAVQKGLDTTASLVRHERELPVRRMSFNIRKLLTSGSHSDQTESRRSKLQMLDCQTLIFCSISFKGLTLLPAEEFSWLLRSVEDYLNNQSLPPGWIARDQIRKVVMNLPRRENTKSFLEGLCCDCSSD